MLTSKRYENTLRVIVTNHHNRWYKNNNIHSYTSWQFSHSTQVTLYIEIEIPNYLIIVIKLELYTFLAKVELKRNVIFQARFNFKRTNNAHFPHELEAHDKFWRFISKLWIIHFWSYSGALKNALESELIWR